MSKKNIHICHSLEEGGISTLVRSLVQLNEEINTSHDILTWNESETGDHIIDISKTENKRKSFKNAIKNYNLIYVHSLKPFMIGALYKRKQTVFLFQHGLTFGSGLNKIYKKCFYTFVINILGFKVICSSHFAKEKLVSNIPIFNKKLIKIIPFGVHLKKLDKVTKSSTTIKIGFAGRLVKQKRVHKIFEALEGINERIDFYIAGDGSLKNDLIKRAQQFEGSNVNVLFLGNVIDMHTFYRKLDVLILPSKHESYGLVVLEAFFNNIPVIVFKDSGACVEFIKNGVNGFVVENSNKLCSVINKMINKDLRDELKLNIKNSDLSMYDLSNTRKELDNL